MKYTQLQKDKIWQLFSQGKSGRAIAKQLGLSKSGVNSEITRQLQSNKPLEGPRVVFLDVESAPAIVAAFQRFDVNLTQNHIIQEGNWLVSFAWKYNYLPDMTFSEVITPENALIRDDFRIASVIYNVLETADYIVGHNLKKFDWKMINLCLLSNGFTPSRKPKLIDTLEIARANFKFPSNKLGDLAKYLGVKVQKGDPGGIETWIKCIQGDEAALKVMGKYNEVDVDVLYQVFLKLQAWTNKIPNYNLYSASNYQQCTVCGSHEVVPTGNHTSTPSKLWLEYSCNSCGHRMREDSKRKLVNIV
jgi:RNase_H superfamily